MNPIINFEEMKRTIQNMMMNNMNDYKINQTMSQMLQMIDIFTNNNSNLSNQNFNSVPEYYKIKNKFPLNDKRLDKTKKNLSLFFNCIYDFNKVFNNIGTKIYINYYNLEKIELYLDLRLNVKDLISTIFGMILQGCSERKIFKRIEKNQTTKGIIESPNFCFESDSPYINALYLEYNNKDLYKLSDKTGREIGLKEDDEIFLKLKEEYFNELKNINLDNTKIIFKYIKTMAFPSFQDEMVSNMIIRFAKFINVNYKFIRFLFNSQELKNSNQKIKDLSNSYANNYFIELIQIRDVNGGGAPLKFSDVSKEKKKYLKFDKNAPKYRTVTEGLNIFGICQNKKCEAYKEEVVYIPENMILEDNKYFKFYLNDEIENMKCPICHKIIKSKTVGFYKCEYQIIGTKIEDGDRIEYDSKPKETEDDEFEYFDPEENGEVQWTKLIIYVLPKQKMKYKSN